MERGPARWHHRLVAHEGRTISARERFRDRDAERLFLGFAVRRMPHDIQHRARMRLQRLVTARALPELRLPPSHRLEALSGDRRGQHSIRINDQWRVCFRWTDQGAMDIEITDYH